MRKLLGNIFISEDASLIREKDFLVLMDAGSEPKTRGDFLHLARQTKKPIKHVFLTHHHWDHVHNLRYFREKFPGLQVISNHRTGSVMRFQSDEAMFLGDTEYLLIPTPGHSPASDDICILLPEKKVLFTGDLCQPQGPSYSRTDFCTPVPYFHDGEKFISSLKKALSLKVNHVITGHGIICRRRALETTLKVAERIKETAKEVVKSSPRLKDSLAAKAIFEAIARERNFHGAGERMRDPYYEECDVKGMLYWVKRFRNVDSESHG